MFPMSDPFERMYRDMLEEEARLRRLAEEQARGLAAVLREVATRLDPERVDALQRENPAALRSLSPQVWRAFFTSLRPNGRSGRAWGSDPGTARVRELEGEVAALRAEVERLRQENARLQEQVRRGKKDGERPGKGVSLPPLPSRPPRGFESYLGKAWQREMTALGVMAVTGYAMRVAVAQALGDVLGINWRSGSVKRLFRRLVENGLIEETHFDVGGRQVALVRLTERGKALLQAWGVRAAENEWERLERLHGGEAQGKHAALVVAFAHNARQFGYETEVCPPVKGPAEPDVALRRDGRTLYVEVEAASGTDERRMKKWRNLADLQGFVALAADTAETRTQLVAEAKAAKTHGKATDVITLMTRESQDDIWLEEW